MLRQALAGNSHLSSSNLHVHNRRSRGSSRCIEVRNPADGVGRSGIGVIMDMVEISMKVIEEDMDGTTKELGKIESLEEKKKRRRKK